MSVALFAKRIPAEVRRLRLLTAADPIANAAPVASNPQMQLLAEVWYTYIEPYKERSYCPVCLDNILNNFAFMKPALIELEEASQLLDGL